jgi:hypothetical protein
MFFVALDPEPENPNPHAWEINDSGPFESYEAAEEFAIQQERELREELDLHADADVSDWFAWTVVYVRAQDAERLSQKMQEISMKRAGYQS